MYVENNHCVVIPAYNEESRIGNLIDRVSFLPVVSVVDGNDGTANIARSLGATVLESDHKRGYGKAMIHGLVYAYTHGYNFATVMDVGTCDPSDLIHPEMFFYDVFLRERKPSRIGLREVISKISAICFSCAMWYNVSDCTFGYRTYNLLSITPLIKHIQTNGHSTNMELLGLCIKHGLAIGKTKVPYYNPGADTQLKAADFVDALRTLNRLRSYEIETFNCRRSCR